MKLTSTAELLNATHGSLHVGDPATLIESVSTDTRSIPERSAFFALAGENFDAHNFLDKAVEGGAAVLVVSRVPEGVDFKNTAVVVVNDTLTALQQFAAWYRQQLDITVVGITGSNGKTSTKDFTKAVLGERFSVTATLGNLNNHIGLPLSVLATEEHHQVCVWEMGMNHAGEIAPLCQIAKPDVGIITNVGTAHIEHLGSCEAIAEEKGELARSLTEEGTLVVSAACDYVEYFSARTRARTLVVGNGRGKVRAENLMMTSTGSEFDLVIDGQPSDRVSLPVVGRHMVANALLAAGAGFTLGMTTKEIAAGLNGAELTSGRLRCFESNGITVFDDTYNANPESMAAAIETLVELKHEGSRYVVLGQMAELGDHADEAHHSIGALAAERGVITVSVGEAAKGINEGALSKGGEAIHFADLTESAEWLKRQCVSGDVVLFKGSRAAGMERVMNQSFPTN